MVKFSEFCPNVVDDYGIFVVFFERGYWSKPYVYLYEYPLQINQIVLVPTGEFYSVGKIVKVVKDYKKIPHIQYKRIIKPLEI
jgi:hypothetical protein